MALSFMIALRQLSCVRWAALVTALCASFLPGAANSSSCDDVTAQMADAVERVQREAQDMAAVLETYLSLPDGEKCAEISKAQASGMQMENAVANMSSLCVSLQAGCLDVTLPKQAQICSQLGSLKSQVESQSASVRAEKDLRC